MDDGPIGVQEAADLLGVTRQMVHKLIKSKDLSAKRLSPGGAWMLSRLDVVGYPKRRVLELADKVAHGTTPEIRAYHDMLTILNRLPHDEVEDIAKAIHSLASRATVDGSASVADGYRRVVDWMDALTE